LNTSEFRISRRQLGVAAGAVAVVGLAACRSRGDTSATRPSDPAAPSMDYTVKVNKPGGAPGYVFFTFGANAANAAAPTLPTGPASGASPSVLVIADKAGNVVWEREMPTGQSAGNLRVQSYQGKPVLTWWQGVNRGGHGTGVNYIADEHYNVITTLTPGEDLSSDIHEFRLTPDGRALISSYQEATTDLTAIGGPADAKTYNSIASVVDIASKKTLFRWDALSHVPISDSLAKYIAGPVFDPYHINSISLDPSGNLLISMRAVSAVCNVDPRSGAINWQLGGRHSTFALGEGVEFAYQHDAQMPDANTLTVFDNHSDVSQGPGPAIPSSLKWIRLDFAGRRATLIRTQTHPGNLVSAAMGNMQRLPGGNTFSGWGTAGRISEFAADGEMVYDAALTGGTYRAFLDAWTGEPADPPRLTLTEKAAHAVWNGATKVVRWRLLKGPQSNVMTPLTTVAWAGYETRIPLTENTAGCYQLQALDAGGAVVNQSPPVMR
jgi:hypothetical protein